MPRLSGFFFLPFLFDYYFFDICPLHHSPHFRFIESTAFWYKLGGVAVNLIFLLWASAQISQFPWESERERKGTTGKGRERLLTGLTELCWHSYTVRVHSPSYFHLSRLQVCSRQVVRLSLFFGLFWLASIERGVDSCFGPGIDPLLLRTYIGS